MSDLYWKYCQEREGVEMVEREGGFATYRFLNPDSIYLQDIYVEPGQRRAGLGKELLLDVETVGRHAGAKYIWASCDTKAKNSTGSLKAILAQNFLLDHTEGSLILLVKEI